MSTNPSAVKGDKAPEDMRKVVIGSFAGALLEWYDFFIFGTASGIILGEVFFPSTEPAIGTMAAFATFGVGFLARPLGGIVFGQMGDRIGRKSALVWTLLIVGLSTFFIGLVPDYNSWGVWAPVLLVILRLLQGFGLGGEYGGAALLTYEHAPAKRRGFFTSLPQAAASAGIMLATGVFALVGALTTEEQFVTWGWRIPFLLSIVLLGVGMWIRMSISETRDFQEAKEAVSTTKEKIALLQILRDHPKSTLLAIGARLGETVSSNVINAFGISYVAVHLMMDRSIGLEAMLIASAIGIIACPIIGALSDRIGQRLIYQFGAGFMALFIFPFFMMLDTQVVPVMVMAFIIAYNLGPTMMFAVQPAFYASLFGARVRYTGLSIAYQFSAIVGGMTPLIASALMRATGDQYWGVALYVMAICLISFFSARALRGREVPNVTWTHDGDNGKQLAP